MGKGGRNEMERMVRKLEYDIIENKNSIFGYGLESNGDEQTALESVFKIFGLTRDIIKHHGRDCIEFTKIAIVVLNQIIRPFTAKWHRLSVAKAFDNPKHCEEFRAELSKLQAILRTYTKMLSDMAGVEDLTELEDI